MIHILSGTNRPDSNTRKISANIESMYKTLGVPVKMIDLAELPQEIFDPSSYGEKPESFAPFNDAVLEASGLVVVTPEYNGGMPGVLKYFIDMLQFPDAFESRPVCFVGVAAGMWGALRPVEQLQQIFGYRNAHIFPERVFMPGVMKVLNDDGKLTDEGIAGRLKTQADNFTSFVEKLRGISLRQ